MFFKENISFKYCRCFNEMFLMNQNNSSNESIVLAVIFKLSIEILIKTHSFETRSRTDLPRGPRIARVRTSKLVCLIIKTSKESLGTKSHEFIDKKVQNSFSSICKPASLAQHLCSSSTSSIRSRTSGRTKESYNERTYMSLKESRKMLKPCAPRHTSKRTNLFYFTVSKNSPRKSKEKRFLHGQNKITGCVDKKTNEPLNKVETTERSRPKIAEEAGSRNSGRLGQPETSKNSRRSTQAGRQIDQPKQSHSCSKGVEERIRKNGYASKSSKKREEEGQETRKRRRYTSKSLSLIHI